jgi:hypothetical protein
MMMMVPIAGRTQESSYSTSNEESNHTTALNVILGMGSLASETGMGTVWED